MALQLLTACVACHGTAPETPDNIHVAGKPQEEGPEKRLWVEFRAQAKVGVTRSALIQGDYLRSGDDVEFFVTLSRAAYLYLYQVSGSGRFDPLFPAGDADALVAKANESTRIPNRGWLQLDNEVGEETVIIVASIRPLSAVDAQAAAALQRAESQGSIQDDPSRASPCDLDEGEAAPAVPSPNGDMPPSAEARVVGETVHRPYVKGPRPERTQDFAATKERLESQPPPSPAADDASEYASLGRSRGLSDVRGRGLVFRIDEADNVAEMLEADAANVIIRPFWFCHLPSTDAKPSVDGASPPS